MRTSLPLMCLWLLLTSCAMAATPENAAPEPTEALTPTSAPTGATPEDAPPATKEPPPAPSPPPTAHATAEPESESPTKVAADDERINYIGRFDFRDPLKPAFDWSGVAIEFAFSGTGLTALLEDGRNSYNVLIDGSRSVLKTETGRENYVLAEDLPPGKHYVRLTKRTEAYVGSAVFKGLQIIGGDLEPPPRRPSLRLEFIGDSITTGYGNEGESPDCWFTPETQNAELTYAAITAKELDAEYALIALGGLGVIRNLREQSTSSPETAIDFIGRTLALNPAVVWPPDQVAPDAVVINLGTNDYSSVPFPEEETFVAAYQELLGAVRSRYPEAVIFAVAGPFMLGPAPGLIREAAEVFGATDGGDSVEYILIEDNLEPSAEDFGCDWHPNVNGHSKIAAQLTPVIAERLGW